MTRQISREEYERLFGPAQQSVVDAVAGHYLAETAFDEAYARLVIQGLSHEDAVRGAQQQLYGGVRSLSVGVQGFENRRAVADYMARRQRAQGGTDATGPAGAAARLVPPAARRAGALAGDRLAGQRLARVAGFSGAGAAAALGALIELLTPQE